MPCPDLAPLSKKRILLPLGPAACVGSTLWYGMSAGVFLASLAVRYGLKGIMLAVLCVLHIPAARCIERPLCRMAEFCRIGEYAADRLGILDLTAEDLFQKFLHRVRLHTDKFILIQVLRAFPQLPGQIDVNLLIAESHCGIDGVQQLQAGAGISCLLLQFPHGSLLRGFRVEEFRRLERNLVARGVILDYYQDTMLVPNGNVAKWDFIDNKGAAAVVAVRGDGKILMVRQYRNALERETLEIPAGGLKGREEPSSSLLNSSILKFPFCTFQTYGLPKQPYPGQPARNPIPKTPSQPQHSCSRPPSLSGSSMRC